MGPIKVAIADDHKIFRKGVILSLEALHQYQVCAGSRKRPGTARQPAGYSYRDHRM